MRVRESRPGRFPGNGNQEPDIAGSTDRGHRGALHRGHERPGSGLRAGPARPRVHLHSRLLRRWRYRGSATKDLGPRQAPRHASDLPESLRLPIGQRKEAIDVAGRVAIAGDVPDRHRARPRLSATPDVRRSLGGVVGRVVHRTAAGQRRPQGPEALRSESSRQHRSEARVRQDSPAGTRQRRRRLRTGRDLPRAGHLEAGSLLVVGGRLRSSRGTAARHPRANRTSGDPEARVVPGWPHPRSTGRTQPDRHGWWQGRRRHAGRREQFRTPARTAYRRAGRSRLADAGLHGREEEVQDRVDDVGDAFRSQRRG